MAKRYLFKVIVFGGVIVTDDEGKILECHKNFQPLVGSQLEDIKRAVSQRKHILELNEVTDLEEYTIEGATND